MKKSKRSFDLEESEPGSSKDVGMDFDIGDEEDEILDLEDIFELPDEDGEEDDDLDVEILDADLDDPDGKSSSEEDDLFGKDILKGFPLDEDREDVPGKRSAKASRQEPDEDILKDLSFLEDLDSDSDGKETKEAADEDILKGFSFEEAKPGKDPDLSGNIIDAADLEALLAEVDSPPQKEAVPVEAPAKIVPAAPIGGAVPEMDDFVSRIESKLVETVREIVEASLPDVVRSVLQQEIERLKNEMK